jgi:hypothetical protein
MNFPCTLRGLEGSSNFLEQPAPRVRIFLSFLRSGQEVVIVFEPVPKVGVVNVYYSHLLD